MEQTKNTRIVDDPEEICGHPEHEPPNHIIIPSGKKMIHTCPKCGAVTVIRSGFYW